jgi:hypothetical protein
MRLESSIVKTFEYLSLFEKGLAECFYLEGLYFDLPIYFCPPHLKNMATSVKFPACIVKCGACVLGG